LLSLREEVAFNAKSSDGEVQRVHARADTIAVEIGAQLTALTEKQTELVERVKAEIDGAVSKERVSTQTSVAVLREEVRQALESRENAENQQRQAALQVVEKRLEDECLGGLRTQEARRESTEAALAEAIRAEREAWQRALGAQRQDVLESVAVAVSTAAHRWGLELEGVNQRASEVSDLRSALATEAEVQAEASSGLRTEAWAEMSCLHQSLKEEELATAALRHAFTKTTAELSERTREFKASLEASMSHGWDNASLGREELWHVMHAVEDQATSISTEVRQLSSRTTTVEVSRLGEVSSQLTEFASLHEEMSSSIQTLENSSLQEYVRLTTRLDECTSDLLRTREDVSKLGGNKHYLESTNARYRLYVTTDGNVAVFPRNDWGRWGSDYSGVPCWQAGCGDKPLCSVNRDMQAHEKERFLALANRDVPSFNERAIMPP
jgi:hypothetical protein